MQHGHNPHGKELKLLRTVHSSVIAMGWKFLKTEADHAYNAEYSTKHQNLTIKSKNKAPQSLPN